MAQIKEPDKDFDPRHRIVGAIILVTLAVIILPLILDERSSPVATTSTIEEKSGSAAVVANASRTGVAAEDEAKPSKVIIKRLSDSKPATKPGPAQEAAKPAAESTSPVRTVVKPVVSEISPTSQDKKEISPVSAKVPDRQTVASVKPHWAVQVGTFSNRGNVRRLGDKLKQRGYSVMFKDVSLKQGTAVRVRVGPYSTRASADQAQGKIVKDIGVKGVVVAGP